MAVAKIVFCSVHMTVITVRINLSGGPSWINECVFTRQQNESTGSIHMVEQSRIRILHAIKSQPKE